MRRSPARLRTAGLALTLAAAMALPARGAEVLIDDFSTAQGQLLLQDPPDSPGDSAGSTVGGAGILGGQRDLVLTWLDGGVGPVSTEVTGGLSLLDVAADSRAESAVTWDGDSDPDVLDATGLGSVDLTGGGTNNALELTVGAVSGLCELIVEVHTDAANASRAATTTSAAGAAFLPFARFAPTLGSGADFADVGAVVLEVAASGAGDCDLAELRAVGPTVTAVKVDALQLASDADGDGEADPGETLGYTIDVGAEGGTAAGVELEDTVGSNLTFVGGSLRVTPVAADDGYSSVGNVQLSVGAGSGLLSNDFDPDDALPGTPITDFDAVSLQGGTVSVNATDGSFTYDAPSQFTGVDSFSYEITDSDGLTDTGKVDILVEGIVWFVDDTHCASPCGSGTQSDPFGGFDPTQLNGAGGSGDLDGPDDIIYVRTGSGATDTGDAAGFELEDGQQLLGEGVDLIVNGVTIVPAGAAPTLTNTAGTAGHGLTLAEDNTVRGLDLGDVPAASRRLTDGGGGVGSLTIGTVSAAAPGVVGLPDRPVRRPEGRPARRPRRGEVAVAGTGGVVSITGGGTLDVTFGNVSSTASSGGPAIHLVGVGGSFTVTNPGAGTDTSIAAADAGISVQGSGGASFSFGETSVVTNATGGDGVNLGGTAANPGATVGFDDLAVTAGAGNALLASNTGTLDVGGTTSALGANGGAALDVSSTSLGTGATFATLTSSGSPGVGVRLDSTSGGPFAVLGNVDIDEPTTVGIRVTSATSATFSGGSKSITDAAGGVDGAIGVQLTGTSVSFTNGGLDIDTTTGIGFQATAGGTINVSGAGNTIDVAGAAAHALDLNGVAIGAVDMTFDTITATGGITAEGIDIDGTTNAGTFDGGVVTLTGTGGAGIDINGSSATFNFTSANITSAAGAGINLNGANGVVTVTAVDIDGSGGAGLQVTGNTSAVNINGGTIGGSSDNGSAAAASVDVDGAAASITVAASITNSADRSVDIRNSGVGTFTFSGAIDDDGTGIFLDNNDQGGAATINFRGGIALDTGASTAVNATGGGTVEVCEDTTCDGNGGALTNTIGAATALTATAVNIADTAIGTAGITFESISVNGGGGANVAIALDDSGAGAFTVAGDGTTTSGGNGSGGTIENITDADAITLRNTDGRVTLRNLIIEDIADSGDAGDAIGTRSQRDAIHGEQVDGGLTLESVTIRRISDNAVNGGLFADGISQTTWNGLEIRDSVFENTNRFHVAGRGDDADEGILRIKGLTGTVVVEDSTFQDGASGLDLLSVPAAGTLDVTIQGSSFTDLYKEFACSGTINVGRRGITVEVEGAQNAVVRIGDPDEADPSLGNSFLNNFTASIVVNGQEGGGNPHTGTIETVISQNTFTVTDHLTGPPGCPDGTFQFNFPQGGVSLNPADSSTYEAIFSNNVFDEVMHAAGGLGQLTLGLNGGDSEIVVTGNTFGLPWDAAMQLRAEGTGIAGQSSAAVLIESNTWIDGLVGGPGDDVGFATQSPFSGLLINVLNQGDLDVTVRDEDLPEHDNPNNPVFKEALEAEVQNQASNVLDIWVDDSTAPWGYGLTRTNGTFNLFAEENSITCGGGPTPQDILDDNGNTGGGGNPATDPPFVAVSGTILCSTTPPTVPSPTIP